MVKKTGKHEKLLNDLKKSCETEEKEEEIKIIDMTKVNLEINIEKLRKTL